MAKHKELRVWQKAMDLVDGVYRVTRLFPKEEQFGLTTQLRRSAVSVASNIAEGCGRNSKKEFLQFIGIANGSLAEAETQLLIAKRQSLAPFETIDEIIPMVEDVGKLLTRLAQSLRL